MDHEQAKLKNLARELARRKVEERLRYFRPNAGQERFLAEIGRPGAFVVWQGGGNGSGKSHSVVGIVAALCWPDLAPPDVFSAPIFRNWPHPKRIRICSTPKELDTSGSLQTTIKELFPRKRYEARRKGKTFPSEFLTDSGWIVDLFSYDQDPSEMAGPSLGLVIFNEPPPENLFKESIARTRLGGLILGAATSLRENVWLVDGILGKANGQDIRVTYSDIEDNCRQHSPNGHGALEHEQIEKILSQYDDEEREARKTGKPLSLSGRIYKSFDRAVHVAKDPIIPPERATFYMVVDPAVGKPFAIVYAFMDPAGILHVYKESPDHEFEGSRDPGFGVKEYAELIKRLDGGREIECRILDRHFGNARRAVGGATLRAELGECGLDFLDSYSCLGDEPEVESGILGVREWLRFDKSKPLDSINRPRLIISPECPNTIKSFERWSRNQDTGKPRENFKDFADCVRYLCMAHPEYSEPRYRDWTPGRQPYYGVNNG